MGIISILKEWGTLKKLTVSTLGLIILVVVLLWHGTFPAANQYKIDLNAKMILQMDQTHEDLPLLDPDNDTAQSLLNTVIQLLFIRLFFNKDFPANACSSIFAFLTAIFFQSNYVFNSLWFLSYILKIKEEWKCGFDFWWLASFPWQQRVLCFIRE